MNTGLGRGVAAAAVLLLAGCLLACQEGVQNAGTASVVSSSGQTWPADECWPGPLSPGVPCITYDNDVGVWDLISPGDFGDTQLVRILGAIGCSEAERKSGQRQVTAREADRCRRDCCG
jgi:hypothetical protein